MQAVVLWRGRVMVILLLLEGSSCCQTPIFKWNNTFYGKSLPLFLTSKWLKPSKYERHLSCMPAEKLLFSDLFSEFSWPAFVLAIWQHIVESRGAWHGELARLCMAIPPGWKPVAIPAEIHGRTCQRLPLFYKVGCQFISMKAVKPKIKSKVFEDMLWVWWLLVLKDVS